MIFSNNETLKEKIKTVLKSNFKMKDLGEAKCCVGLNITRNQKNGQICVDQSKYIRDILDRFNMADCNPVKTPYDSNQKLTTNMSPQNKTEEMEMSNVPYQEAVGSLIYLSQGTRPDIAYAVNSVSKFCNNPGKAHWGAVKRIFRYIKGTVNAKLCFSKDANSNLIGFCDADWANDEDERRSCTGYVFVQQGGAITWNCKRQQTVALSTTEAEYMALSAATQEAIWLKQFISEIGMSSEMTNIYCDNKSAINLSANNSYHARTKHIDVRHHFIRQKVNNKEVSIQHTPTEDMVADALTKGLFKDKHLFCAKNMGLKFE